MRTSDPAVLLIEPTDFETFPAGGQLSVSRSLMKYFGARLALVGMTPDEWPIGQWTKRDISGTPFLFFSIGRAKPLAEKPLIPARLAAYFALRRFRRRILSLGCRAAFIQAPEALLATSHWGWNTMCYAFPGVDNHIKSSRYPLARPLWRSFDSAVFSALDRVDLILASADKNAIGGLVARSKGRLSRERVLLMPTCVDTSVFHPIGVHNARTELSMPRDSKVFVSCGRIAKVKGWKLLLDAFQEYLHSNSSALLFFVGDGEDRPSLEAEVRRRDLSSRVTVTGFQERHRVAFYVNSADVILCGSFIEGWSVAMLEALACGKPIVSTEVSGASTMIKPGRNGFIINTRDPVKFADAMTCALDLPEAEQLSLSIAREYDLDHLGERLSTLWPPFRQEKCDGQNMPRQDVLKGSLPVVRSPLQS